MNKLTCFFQRPIATRLPPGHNWHPLQAFTMLCADETPMVRRAAAHKMRDFVSVCAKQEGWSGGDWLVLPGGKNEIELDWTTKGI